MVVLGIVTVMALLEVVGVGSVMPFLSGHPEMVETNDVLSWLIRCLAFKSRDHFLIFLGSGAFGLVLFSGVFRIAAHYVMKPYVQMRRHGIGERLFETCLRQPYAFFP